MGIKGKKFLKFIKKGRSKSLAGLPFHSEAPIKRLLMLDKNLIKNANTHIAAHFIKDIPEKSYTSLHRHKCDEINLILSEGSKLTYNIYFEDEVYKVSSPATIFIPKGVRHRAEAISGEGVFISLVLDGKYGAFK